MLDEPYATVARNLAQLVKSKPVCNVFVSKVVKLGTDKNNVWIETPTRHVHTWNHLFYKLPNHLLCAVSDSEEAVQGALRTNKTVLKRALDELSMDAFDIVLDLISQGSLYRGDQYKSDLEAFVALKKKYEVVPREERDNFCWVESAKVGYVGFSSILNKTTNLINMERELYNWLEREFYKSNHTKYHRYFKEWITNICPHQVEGFRNQMIGQLTKSKVK